MAGFPAARLAQVMEEVVVELRTSVRHLVISLPGWWLLEVEVAVVLQAHQHLLVVVILVYLLQEALLDVLLVAQVQLLY